MSVAYDDYIFEHRDNVRKAFQWLEEHTGNVLAELDKPIGWDVSFTHDESKYSAEEYKAYDDFFYGGNRSKAVKDAFDLAWLHHIHNNPHHWQYWVLINDEAKEGIKALEMPEEYVIEMICDWWSFSFKKGNLREIFDWYEVHKAGMMLHEKTKKKVEWILSEIKKELDRIDEEGK